MRDRMSLLFAAAVFSAVMAIFGWTWMHYDASAPVMAASGVVSDSDTR